MTDETTGSPAPEQPGDGEAAPPQAREWLAQLQQMIDNIASHAAPVAREVAAKAAELAAAAGEKAGPFAKRAAEVTGDVGVKVADRSRRFADDLRHRAGVDDATAAADDAERDAAAAADAGEVPPEAAPPEA